MTGKAVHGRVATRVFLVYKGATIRSKCGLFQMALRTGQKNQPFKMIYDTRAMQVVKVNGGSNAQNDSPLSRRISHSSFGQLCILLFEVYVLSTPARLARKRSAVRDTANQTRKEMRDTFERFPRSEFSQALSLFDFVVY